MSLCSSTEQVLRVNRPGTLVCFIGRKLIAESRESYEDVRSLRHYQHIEADDKFQPWTAFTTVIEPSQAPKPIINPARNVGCRVGCPTHIRYLFMDCEFATDSWVVDRSLQN